MGGAAQWAGESEDFDPLQDLVDGINIAAENREIEAELRAGEEPDIDL